MKRVVTLLLVVGFLLSFGAPLARAQTPTPGTPPASATATKGATGTATATPARGATPSGTAPGATAPAPAATATAAPTAVVTGTPTSTATTTTAPTTGTAAPAACPATAPIAAPTSPLKANAQPQQELAALRTRTSRTVAIGADAKAGRGMRVVTIAPGSLNFQDSKGAWQPIDNTLVAGAAGYAWQNKANRYTLALPASPATPVHVALGGASVDFALVGARGSGAPCGATAIFADALPGVTLAYTAANDAVEETLTLASAAAPHTFVYRLATGGGLTARANGAGGIDFVDGAGKTQFAFAPPVMDDRAGAHSAAASLTLGGDASGQTVTLAASAAWLADPARKYPVVIDPQVTFTPASQDCYLVGGSSANTSFCGGTSLNVGFDGTKASRALAQFDLGTIPANAAVLNAQIGLYRTTTDPTTSQLGLYAVTRSWTTGATWNKYDGTNAWTTAGGDFAATAAYTDTVFGGAPGWENWYPTALVQGWANGTTANRGFLVKQTTEGGTDVAQFASSHATDSTKWPVLTVSYQPMLGQQRAQGFVGQGLSERMDLAVNVANGNLLIHARDLRIAGTGLALTFDRWWNNLNETDTTLGEWTSNVGPDVRLQPYSDG